MACVDAGRVLATSDQDELHELLDVSARSIASFIDETVAGIYRQLQVEREALTRGTHAEHREIVALILDGAPITRQHAERLALASAGPHRRRLLGDDRTPNCPI